MQLRLGLWSVPDLTGTDKDTCICVLPPKHHRLNIRLFPFHACSSGTPNIYWSDAPVLQRLCKLSQMLSHPIFGACILFFFFFFFLDLAVQGWVQPAQWPMGVLGSACPCSLLTHKHGARGDGWPGISFPPGSAPPRCPTASNTGTSNCFSNVNS